MFENIINFFKNIGKKDDKKQDQESSKEAAKERLHLVLMQDRVNVSADFLELMKQEIIEVIKKYIEIDEQKINVKLENIKDEDGTNGAPALYANIPILNIKNDVRKVNKNDTAVDNEKGIEKENNKESKNVEINKKEPKENDNKEVIESKQDDNNKEENIKEEKKDDNNEDESSKEVNKVVIEEVKS